MKAVISCAVMWAQGESSVHATPATAPARPPAVPAAHACRRRAQIHLSVKFAGRLDAPVTVLNVDNENVTLTNESFHFSALGRQKPKTFQLHLQLDRAIVPGQRRELHLYAPADVAAARKAIEEGGQLLHVVMDPDALANKEFALCRYSTVLRIANVKPSVHRTMMGTNVESLLLDVIGTRRAEVGGLVHEEPYVAVMAAEPNTAQDSSPQGRRYEVGIVRKKEIRVGFKQF